MNASPANRTPKIGLILVGRKRPGFDPEWGAKTVERVRHLLTSSPFEVFEPEVRITDDPTIREAIAECRAAQADVLLVMQPTMGDARLAPTVCQLWDDPLCLIAPPENQTGDMISSCSLVGLHAWGSILRQLGHPFEIVTADPDSDDARRQLERAVRVAYAARRVRLARLGQVGGQAPGYFAMQTDSLFLGRRLGAQLQTYTLVEFIERARGLSDDEVRADIETVRARELPLKDIEESDLDMASRCYLAMRSLMAEEALDALAIRCWPELPNELGQWPYLGMARLSEEGEAVACEGDVEGALTCAIGAWLGLGPGYLSDWLEHDAETITLWHGGNAPLSLCCGPDSTCPPRIARHFNNKKPTVLESTLQPGAPVTVFRLWHCDDEFWMSAREAENIEPRRHLMGTNGLARLTSGRADEWFDELCHAGMPHHVAVFGGRHADALRRLARALGLIWLP